MTFKKISITLAAAFLAGQVSAAPITDWDFTLDSIWENWNNPTDLATAQSGQGVWGDGQTLLWGLGFQNSGQSSSLVIDELNISGMFNLVDVGGGVWSDTVAGSIITHFNKPIASRSVTLQDTQLNETFTLSAAGGTPAFAPINSIFNVLFEETRNSAPCEGTSISVCDDIFVVLNPGELTQLFNYDGYTYALAVSATGLGPLSDAACALAGASAGCIGLQTQENSTNEVQFFITLSSTATPVPEPSILGLVGFGLLGMGLIRRRRSA